MFLFDFFKTLHREQIIVLNEIEKIQLRIFSFVLVAEFFKIIYTLYNIFLLHDDVYSYTSIFISLSIILLLIIFFIKPKFLHQLIHLSFGFIFINLAFKTLVNGIFYITDFQTIFMTIVWSFYALKKNVALTYAICFASIIFIHISIYGTNIQLFPTQNNSNFYPIWVLYILNNLIFLWSHYYYYNNIIHIVDKKRELNKVLLSSLKNNTQFSETITNKLKAPLHNIIQTSNNLLEKNDDNSMKKDLELLKFSSKNLLELINNILYYNNLKNKNEDITHQKFDLLELLQNIIDSFRSNKANSSKEYILSYPDILNNTLIISDKQKIMQILYNLLGNATKFTADNGIINLDVTKSEFLSKSSIKLKFSIEDNGIGIPKNKLFEVFEPFKQLDNTITRKYPGTGLGLAIVKKTLESLNSNIYIESTTGIGTKIYFELDLLINPKSNEINCGILNNQSN